MALCQMPGLTASVIEPTTKPLASSLNFAANAVVGMFASAVSPDVGGG